ncbi:MAG: hypothetical protein AAGC96_07255 [Pseudomonadota bacterium]
MHGKTLKSVVAATAITLVSTVLANAYAPSAGDPVVVYLNTFNSNDFETAKQIMQQDLAEEIYQSGQDRQTFLLANPDTSQITKISFFKRGSSADRSHRNAARTDVLKKLEPLRSAPLLQVESITVLAPGESVAATAQPADNDPVVVRVNKFDEETYTEARQILIEDLGKPMVQHRYSYWMANPETQEIAEVSFYKKDGGEDHQVRNVVQSQIEPLYRVPQIRLDYEVIGSQDTNS